MDMSLRDAAKAALEALDAQFGWSPGEFPKIDDLRAALEAEPAEPAEPVAWAYRCDAGFSPVVHWDFTTTRFAADVLAARQYPKTHSMQPLYTSPPARQPLRGEQIVDIARSHGPKVFGYDAVPEWVGSFARAIERAHGIGATT